VHRGLRAGERLRSCMRVCDNATAKARAPSAVSYNVCSRIGYGGGGGGR